jgi:antitoxin VapB
MSETGTARIFMHGRSQAVRLPEEFRLPGKEVRVRRFGLGLPLEPVGCDRGTMEAVFAEIDRRGGCEFLPDGRPEQPPMPVDDRKLFDE